MIGANELYVPSVCATITPTDSAANEPALVISLSSGAMLRGIAPRYW
ncbi:MAG TPA: hypothetical protein VI384_02935 [Candidatus Dormibacteraeota bacterium]